MNFLIKNNSGQTIATNLADTRIINQIINYIELLQINFKYSYNYFKFKKKKLLIIMYSWNFHNEKGYFLFLFILRFFNNYIKFIRSINIS